MTHHNSPTSQSETCKRLQLYFFTLVSKLKNARKQFVVKYLGSRTILFKRNEKEKQKAMRLHITISEAKIQFSSDSQN